MNIRLRLTIMTSSNFCLGNMVDFNWWIHGANFWSHLKRKYWFVDEVEPVALAGLQFIYARFTAIADNILVLKVLGLAHIAAGIAIYFATQATNSTEMYWDFFATSCFICQLLLE
jgi:hypothetical protein